MIQVACWAFKFVFLTSLFFGELNHVNPLNVRLNRAMVDCVYGCRGSALHENYADPPTHKPYGFQNNIIIFPFYVPICHPHRNGCINTTNINPLKHW